MKPTTRLFLSSIAAGCTALLISCASTQNISQNRESMLVASGFKVITPKTAAQKQKLQKSSDRNGNHGQKGQENVLRFPGPGSQSGVRRWAQGVPGLSTAPRR